MSQIEGYCFAGNVRWSVPSQYTDIHSIGGGSYGNVASAKCKVNGIVAIKKLIRPFAHVELAKKTYRELVILAHVHHENIIHLLNVFTSSSGDNNNTPDIYFVMPLMNLDLAQRLKRERFTLDKIEYIVYQLMRGIHYLHCADLIHRDLKPHNIGINKDCTLKIMDLGETRKADPQMTGYIITRNYRAPEILFQKKLDYTKAVDMWSIGCIVAEVLTNERLFKARSYLNHVELIFDLTGAPSEEYYNSLLPDLKAYINSEDIMEKPRKDFSKLSYFSGINKSALDLIDKLLIVDPNMRMSSTEALSHEFLQNYHEPSEETGAQDFHDPLLDSDADISIAQFQKAIFEKIKSFEPYVESNNQ